MNLVRKSLAIILLATSSFPIFAQSSKMEGKIDTVVVRAQRRITDVGLTQTRIDSMVLVSKVSSSLSEILSENTPVFIKSYGRGSVATASFRGTAPSHTQVYWNGVSINSPSLGSVDFSLIPVYFIDELSLQHGASSIKSGQGSLGGSVVISNKPDWDNTFGGRFVQAVGSYGTFDDFIQVNVGGKKLQTKTKLYYTQSANDFRYRNKDNWQADGQYPLVRNEHAGYKKASFMEEVYYRPTSNSTLSATVWGLWSDRNLPRLTTNESDERSNLSNQEDKNLVASLQWKTYGKRHELAVSMGYNGQLLGYTQSSPVGGNASQLTTDASTRSNIGQAQVSFRYNIAKDFTVVSTTSANLSSVDSFEEIKGEGFDKSRTEWSELVSVHKVFADRISATALLRLGQIEQKFYTTPYLGVEVLLHQPNDLRIKASVGKSFHYPTLNDLYYVPGGNPDLKTENGITYELGLSAERTFSGVKVGAEVTGYISKIDNWIIWLPSFKQIWTPENVKRVDASGVELKLNASTKIGEWAIRANGVFAYTSSINKGDPRDWADGSIGKQLVYIPKTSGNLFAQLQYRSYQLGYQFTYYGKRFTTTSNDKEVSQGVLNPYFMSDLTLGKFFRMAGLECEAEFKICNLLNEEYRTILQRPMPRQNYMGTLKIKF